jgi:hypothetical protein
MRDIVIDKGVKERLKGRVISLPFTETRVKQAYLCPGIVHYS